MYYYIFGGVILLLALWALGSYLTIRNLEEPTYTVIEKRDGYEIRQYEPYIQAETTVTNNNESGLNEGFRVVADYIFGNNTSQSKIAMTAPVLEGEVSEKIAMTVPVLDGTSKTNERTVAFVLPSEYTLESLPTPNNDAVRITSVAAQTVAARTFSWYGTPSRVANQKATLQTLLDRDDITTVGAPQAAFYNPPLSMPLLLRNEILIPIE